MAFKLAETIVQAAEAEIWQETELGYGRTNNIGVP
jgi:hypothetical protein